MFVTDFVVAQLPKSLGKYDVSDYKKELLFT